VGDLFYDGLLYTRVKMRLDLYRDELVVATANNWVNGSVLDPSRFGWADFKGYRTIHVREADSGLSEGYYQQLHGGDHEVLKKEEYDFNIVENIYTNRSTKYYIKNGDVYLNVGRRKGVILRALGGHRSELDRYIRSAELDIRRDTDRALVEIVREYERLTDL
jgi:hypothetical protein